MFSKPALKDYEETQKWFGEYMIKRDKVWKKKEAKLQAEGMSEEDLETEKLCFNAETFHKGYQKFEKLGMSAAEEYAGEFYFETYEF